MKTHGRCPLQHIFCNQILADNDNHHTGRTDILLYTAIDHSVLGHIYRLRKKAGRNICHQSLSLGVRQSLKLRAIDP